MKREFMRYFVVALLSGCFLLPAQTLQPLQRFDNTVGPAPYYNPAQDTLQRSVKRALPSRRSALPSVLDKMLPPLSEAELDKLKPAGDLGGRPYLKTVGIHRSTGVDLSAAGRWQSGSDGARVFRFALGSPGAHGIRLHFERFHAGAGRVWLHDGTGEESEVFGPYMADGPWSNGEFWSDYVLAETVILEFEPAPGFREGDPLPFEVREISHLADSGEVLPMPDPKSRAKQSEAVSCHLDATCYPEWQQSARGIARMLFEVEGGAATCSGTLLNTRPQSNIPWFLTADHCISDEASARSLQAFWFYQTASCNGAPPDLRSVPRTLGASYVAGIPFERGDATLLRLREIPNGVVFQGWSPDNVALTGTATGIHHPAGSHRRISFGSLREPVAYSGIQVGAFIGVQLDGGGLTQPGSSGSALFARPGVIIGQLSHGPKMEINEYCARLPFPIAYARFSLFYPVIRQYLENGGADNAPPQNNTRALTAGTPVSLTMPAVDAPTLFGDTFEVSVPQGSTRLEIKLTAPADAEVGVLARFGQAPVVENGQAIADSSQTGKGSQTIVLAPPRAGTYFVRMALITTKTQVPVTLVANVAAAPAAARQLTSGQAVPFQFSARPNSALYNGASGFTIQVPAGAQRLEVQIRTETANADVDLYVRRGEDVTVADRQIVADARSEGTGGNEDIVISSVTPGTYYIALTVVNSNLAVSGQIRATAVMASDGGNVLTSGQPRTLNLPAVQNATILNGADGYRIDVPAGATQLEVTLRSSAQADIDLFVRPNADVAVDGNRVVADWRSENNDSNESVVISGANLRPGTYYIALVQFTRNVAAQAVLTATVTGGTTADAPGRTTVLTPGRAANFRIGPVSSPTLFTGENGFLLRVPQGATRVDLNLRTATQNADVDLFVRRGREVAIEERRPVFDYSSESASGQEAVVIDSRSNPPLQPGDYYIALALFNTDVEASGTITATVVTGSGSGGGTQPGAPTQLSPGQPAPFQLPAVDQPTLFNGNYSYVIDVPQGAARLQINLSSEFSQVDTDLYVRYEAQPELSGGSVIAEYTASTDFASETLTVSSQSAPALRPGKYYISIATFTTGAATRGTVTATVSRGIFAQTQMEESKPAIESQQDTKAFLPMTEKSETPKLKLKHQTGE